MKKDRSSEGGAALLKGESIKCILHMKKNGNWSQGS